MDGSKLEDAPDPLVGRTIGGRYLICELIGTGGMGAVYRGRHQLVGRDVALKFLAPRYASDASARERFLREARAANRIDHEHIIDITDFGETADKLVFLVMEYLEGEPLSKIIEKGPIEPRRALNIGWQLATALARAHELDVIHRDIKPDNIFVLQRRGGDFVKLLDFGLAKVLGEHRLTATGKVFGTPEYLAPEQARGEPLTGHADQYALGCVLYEMLTGTLPFEGPSPEVVIKHLHARPEPPSKLVSELGPEVDALCARMMEKSARDRFTDAYHVADELRALLDQLQGGRGSKPPRRSGVLSVPAPETQATQPWVDPAEETWAQRHELFQSLLPRAYPGGDVPDQVRRGLREMGQQVELARQLRRQLSENLLRAKEHEDNLRAARLRVGHAADELGQDESRVSRRIADAQAGIEGVQQRLDELAAPLREGLNEVIAMRDPRAPLGRAVIERLRNLGGSATLWLETEAQLASLSSRVVAGEREREDLRFQIAQLKGRLGILNAEADAELNALRAQAESIEGELSHVFDLLARHADPVSRALQELPGVRDALLQGKGSVPSRSAAPRA
jgi:predicted  nucleic acid-binding Zn-ribbon protein/predicted Ser/Thr protein kinase